MLPVIVYVAGYCCYAVPEKMKCKHCKDLLIYDNENDVLESYQYVDGLSRGSLMRPNPLVTNIVIYNYVVINRMAQNQNFHRIGN